MGAFKPKLVITLHGIRTKAKWQKQVGDLLSTHSIPHASIDYGYYNAIRFLWRRSNDSMVEWFCNEYDAVVNRKDNQVDLEDYRKRPSVIAHSFGTYIVGYCLQKYEHVKFDKVVFCGSILPVDFDWSTLLHRDQVHLVRNEYGLMDPWTRHVGKFVPRTGEGGARGFTFRSNNFVQQRFDFFNHSDFFGEGHVRSHWLPFLARDPSPLYARQGREIEDLSEFTEVLRHTREVIDRTCFGELPHYPEVALPPDLSSRWIAIEPDIYTFLVDRRKQPLVQGYMNTIPLERDAFERVKAGTLTDNQILPDDIAPFDDSDRIYLYLMSMAVAPESRQVSGGLVHQALEKLLCGVVDKLIHYWVSHRVRVAQFVGVGWTAEGRRLCRMIGMEEVGRDPFDNPIFWVDLESEHFRSRTQRLHPVRRLVEAYRKG